MLTSAISNVWGTKITFPVNKDLAECYMLVNE